MKKIQAARASRGFTMIELLIVITIIAVLSLVGFSFVSKMKKKATQVKSMNNMRQIGQMAVGYGADHGGRLMPIKEWRKFGNGGEYHVHWHQAIIEDIDTTGQASANLWNRNWWLETEPIVLNPLLKNVPTWQIWTPGYAMHNKIHQNVEERYEANKYDEDGNLLSWEKRFWGSRPSLAAIPDPARTPLLVQNLNYHIGGFLNGTKLGSDKRLEKFLIEGKMSIIFVDGHSELLRFADDKGNRLPTCEYVERGLDQMPEL